MQPEDFAGFMALVFLGFVIFDIVVLIQMIVR